MAAIEIRKAAAELRAIWVAGNEYLQHAAPWTAAKTDIGRAAAITRFGLNLCRLYGVISAPFIPDAAAAILAALGEPAAPWPADVASALAALPPGRAFAVPENLFEKLTDERRAELEARFAGAGQTAGTH
jgi:methionyl-tRNA synthetase